MRSAPLPASYHPLSVSTHASSSRRPPPPPPSKEAEIAKESTDRIPKPRAAAAAMGISSMPAPRDSLMAYLLYNTVVSLAALAGLVRAALVFLDLQDALLPGDDGDQLAASGTGAISAGPTAAAERFRSCFRPARFGAMGCQSAADCRVCLARFEPESAVNRLPCGHLFHSDCLETWLRYDRATCPLCRARLLPLADEPPPAQLAVAY